jgi:hypothetical protein
MNKQFAVVKKNRVTKIKVAQSPESIKLQEGESVHEMNRPMIIGERFESAWTQTLKFFKIK